MKEQSTKPIENRVFCNEGYSYLLHITSWRTTAKEENKPGKHYWRMVVGFPIGSKFFLTKFL
jgi:hypothetical protein